MQIYSKLRLYHVARLPRSTMFWKAASCSIFLSAHPQRTLEHELVQKLTDKRVMPKLDNRSFLVPFRWCKKKLMTRQRFVKDSTLTVSSRRKSDSPQNENVLELGPKVSLITIIDDIFRYRHVQSQSSLLGAVNVATSKQLSFEIHCEYNLKNSSGTRFYLRGPLFQVSHGNRVACLFIINIGLTSQNIWRHDASRKVQNLSYCNGLKQATWKRNPRQLSFKWKYTISWCVIGKPTATKMLDLMSIIF